MTSFALLFMIASMSSVTLLAVYCLRRILTAPPPAQDDE